MSRVKVTDRAGLMQGVFVMRVALGIIFNIILIDFDIHIDIRY